MRVQRNDVEITLGSARRTAVFCALALHPGHALSREQLVAAVWGEDAPASAAGNVYTYVSALRHILEPARGRWGAGRLLTSGGGAYQLHVAPESVDVFRFESLREAARRHRDADETDAEMSALEAALQLWRGDALTAVPGPFADTHRRRLTELRAATAERFATLLGRAGRHEEAVRVLRQLVDAYPQRDDLRSMLAGALGSAWPGRRVVGGPAGLAPIPPDPRPGEVSAVDDVAPWKPPDRPTLIGRSSEIRWLRRAVAEAVLGRGRSLRVDGVAGIGKSALLAAALRDAVPSVFRLGWAASDELAERLPLSVLLECVESAMSDVPTSHLVKQLFAVAADAPDTPVTETVDRAVGLLCRAAADAPLALVVDDLQWADPITLRVWTKLGERTPRLPLLLVAAARPGLPEPHRLRFAEVLTLAPLDTDAATSLVRAVTTEPPRAQQLARILDEAGGNPYYLRHLAARGPDGPDSIVTGAADDMVAAVGVHLAPFTDDTRQVLRSAAFLSAYELMVPGPYPVGCPVGALAAVAERTSKDLALALEPALNAGLLHTAGDRVVFPHRVVARTLHEGTPTALRTTLHRSLGMRLADAGRPPEEVVAQFVVGDVPLDGAVGSWLSDHVEQLANRAPQLATTVLHRARAHCALDPAQRLSFTAWLARLLLQQSRHAAAEAGWVAARTTDPELEGNMHWVAARSQEKRGDFEAAATIAHAALRERRVSPHWMAQMRELLNRVRPHLPGDPTVPRLSRSELLHDGARVPHPTRDAPAGDEEVADRRRESRANRPG